MLKAYVRVIKNKRTGYSFFLYARACILNNSECNLIFYYGKPVPKKLVAGQQNNNGPLLLSDKRKLRVGFPNNCICQKKMLISKYTLNSFRNSWCCGLFQYYK